MYYQPFQTFHLSQNLVLRAEKCDGEFYLKPVLYTKFNLIYNNIDRTAKWADFFLESTQLSDQLKYVA